MRRRLRKLVVLLIIGVAINVGISWVLAFVVDPSLLLYGVSACDDGNLDNYHWFTARTDVNGGRHVVSYWTRTPIQNQYHWGRDPGQLLPGWLVFERPDVDSPTLHSRRIVAIGWGWPMPSVLSVSITDELRPQSETNGRRTVETATFGFSAGLHPSPKGLTNRQTRLMPIVPAWPGFVVNTLVYSTALWLLSWRSFQLRLLIRRFRNHCVRCNYDLRGTEHVRCPECGEAVRSGISRSPA